MQSGKAFGSRCKATWRRPRGGNIALRFVQREERKDEHLAF